MSLADALTEEVESIFAERWTVRDGQEVPETEDLQLGNHASRLTGTVLYADLAESTELVTSQKSHFAAEIYKAYLYCAAKIIRQNSGVITAYDGDRVMGVFLGNSKNTSAAKAALNINYCVTKIINPKLRDQYPGTAYTVKQAVGIDTSELFVARTGIRGSNDLVWVGRAANYAAKLCALRDGPYASWITTDVYNRLKESSRLGGSEKQNMWEKRFWKRYGITVYRSNWWSKP